MRDRDEWKGTLAKIDKAYPSKAKISELPLEANTAAVWRYWEWSFLVIKRTGDTACVNLEQNSQYE